MRSGALATCVSLVATADAMLSDPPANKNYGSHPFPRVGGKDTSLVRFDLGSVPASATVESATLRLTARGAGKSQTTVGGDNNLTVDIRYAQTFTVGLTGTLTGIDLRIAWMGVDPDATVTITRLTSDGRPDESNALGSATLGGSAMIGTPPPTHFDLSTSNVSVHAGDKLAIVVTSTDMPAVTGDVAVMSWGQGNGVGEGP